MSTTAKGALIFTLIIIAAFLIGSYILTAAFFGTIMLIGMIVLTESIPPIKWVISRTSQILDILIFVFTIAATAKYGLNIAASLTIAGIGYTLIYAPHLREQRRVEKANRKARKNRKPMRQYMSNFNRD